MNDNYQAETVDTAESTEVTTEGFQDAFDDAWDSDGYTEAESETVEETEDATSDASEADQHEEEVAADDNAAEAAEPESVEDDANKAGDQRFTVKAFDEIKELDLSNPQHKEEALTLMQKGLGFDRKVENLNGKITEYEEFLKELAEPLGLNIEQLIDTTRARLFKAEEEKAGREISETDALLKVQGDRAAKKTKAEQQGKAAADEAKQRNDDAIKKFIASEYGKVDPKTIPQSVWDDFHKNGDLIGAYTRYENGKLKAEMEAMKQNQKNEQRSTGSRKTAGASAKKSPFDQGWDDI